MDLKRNKNLKLEEEIESISVKPTIINENKEKKEGIILPEEFRYDPFATVSEENKKKASFTKVLDFSFPDEIEEKVAQIGEVLYIGDGVCRVAGIPSARIDDTITIKTAKGSERALILGIEDTHLESVVLGDYTKVKQGDPVVANNAKLKIATGVDVLGRVMNPLGEPIDGKGPIRAESSRDVEFPAPSVMNRFPIYDPLHTGVMVVDTAIPIGRGQRELVIGDRKTGKTRLALDIISNQKEENVICVYVGVGIQAAKAKAALELLEKRGAMEYTTMVISISDQPPSLQYLSPYVGVAIAEHFLYQGKHVLIVFDDLSKQAKAYRQVSLLLKRSPGRDAYPGDIFFLHSRLLERVSKVSPKIGGGSITALPIAETQAGDVSDYIITNLMSITDGHIFLDANMMHEGILPAVNSGTSVSRIGSKVQCSLLKKVGELTGRVLARYQEVRSFETMNTEVAEDTLRDIKRGKVVTEILAQPSDFNYSVDEEIIFLHIATAGKLDKFKLISIPSFVKNFLEFYRTNRDDDFVRFCNEAKDLKEIEEKVSQILDDFMKEHSDYLEKE